KRNIIFYTWSAVGIAAVVVVAWLLSANVIGISLERLAFILGIAAVVITLLFFAYIAVFGDHTKIEKKRLGVILWLFILAALFWSGFEQAGSSLNLFAERQTDRHFGPFHLIQNAGVIIITAIAAMLLGYL